MGSVLSNQYFVCLKPGEQPIPWNPPDPHPMNWVDYTYFANVFKEMEKHLTTGGLVFYFTWDNVQELPSYGPNVVAVVVGDEWCRIPTYFHKVLATFKCYGTQPILGCNPLLAPTYLNLLSFIQYLYTSTRRLPGICNYFLQQILSYFKKYSLPPIYDLPLGYARQIELPIADFNQRKHDVFFAGSVVHGIYPNWSLKNWLLTPKTISRNQMIEQLDKIQKKQDLNIELAITESFGANSNDNARSYSERMMASKVCLSPRGTSFETFRFFEALRYGCLVITEALPKRWFYEGAPAIIVKSWEELDKTLEDLFSDQKQLYRKHQESLEWWNKKCSEEVVGKFIAENINLLINSL